MFIFSHEVALTFECVMRHEQYYIILYIYHAIAIQPRRKAIVYVRQYPVQPSHPALGFCRLII